MRAPAATALHRLPARGAVATRTTEVPTGSSPSRRTEARRALREAASCICVAPAGPAIRQLLRHRGSPPSLISVQDREGSQSGAWPYDTVTDQDLDDVIDSPIIELGNLDRLRARVAEAESDPAVRIVLRHAALDEGLDVRTGAVRCTVEACLSLIAGDAEKRRCAVRPWKEKRLPDLSEDRMIRQTRRRVCPRRVVAVDKRRLSVDHLFVDRVVR